MTTVPFVALTARAGWSSVADRCRVADRRPARAGAGPCAAVAPARGEPRIGGCWVCFPRGLTGRGDAGDVAWAAAGGHARGRRARPAGTSRRRGRAVPSRAAGAEDRSADGRDGAGADDASGRAAGRRDGPRPSAGSRVGAAPRCGARTCPRWASPIARCSPRGSGPKTVAATPARSGSGTPWSPAGSGRVPASARWSCIRDGGSISPPQSRSWLGTTGQRRTPEPLRRARQLARTARDAADGG